MNTSRIVPLDPEQAYANVKLLLFKLAWATHHKYGIPYEECLSECHLAFVKALNWRHDPTKGTKFTTTVCNIAKWRLRSLVIGKAEAEPVVEINEEMLGEAPATFTDMRDLMSDLPQDARLLVDMLLETPAELIGLSMTPRQLLRNVKALLIKHHGKTKQQVDDACAAVRARMGEAMAA